VRVWYSNTIFYGTGLNIWYGYYGYSEVMDITSDLTVNFYEILYK